MLAMIYNQTSAQELINIRSTIAHLEPLKNLLSDVRQEMNKIAAQTNDKGMRGSLLNFVSETGVCEEQIKSYITSLLHVFPVEEVRPVSARQLMGPLFECPFDCAKTYEKKIVKHFRVTINDYKVIKEIRELMKSLLNEILYSFMKIRMLSSFSVKELKAESNLF